MSFEDQVVIMTVNMCVGDRYGVKMSSRCKQCNCNLSVLCMKYFFAFV